MKEFTTGAWLTGRGERAERRAAKAEARLAEVDARLAALTAALEFYADPEQYLAIGFLVDRPCGGFADDFSDTEFGERPGKRARAALSSDCKPLDTIHEHMRRVSMLVQILDGKHPTRKTTDRDFGEVISDVANSLKYMVEVFGEAPEI